MLASVLTIIATTVSIAGGSFFIWRQLKIHNEQLKHVRRFYQEQEIRLTPLVDQLSHRIHEHLKDDVSWAATALERANIGQFPGTLFGQRIEEYAAEKRFIADHFTPLLWGRVRHLIEDEKRVIYLFIDSGSTLFHFFRLIGSQMTDALDVNEDWIKKRGALTLLTNNIPGIQSLMEAARPHGISPYGHINIECMILPGEALPAYYAVTGAATVAAIKEYKKNSLDQQGAKIITVTTGNWVRIRRSAPACPNPIALGDGHLGVKQALMDVSDEVYVVCPLGKIFYNVRREPLIRGLNMSMNKYEKAAGSFAEVYIENAQAPKVKLVSTSRPRGKGLVEMHDRAMVIKENLSVADPNADPVRVVPVADFQEQADYARFVGAEIGKTPHVIFEFDQLPPDEGEQKYIEYPNPFVLSKEFDDIVHAQA